MSSIYRSVGMYCNYTFTRENTVALEVVMHFDVLRPSMEDEILSELDVVEVVTKDCLRIGNLHP